MMVACHRDNSTEFGISVNRSTGNLARIFLRSSQQVIGRHTETVRDPQQQTSTRHVDSASHAGYRHLWIAGLLREPMLRPLAIRQQLRDVPADGFSDVRVRWFGFHVRYITRMLRVVNA